MMLREPWRTRLLFLSVALNLFAAALIGAFLLHRPRHHPPGFHGVVERFAQDLSPEDTAAFRRVMDEARDEERLARTRMDVARRAVFRAIGQDPYDEQAVRNAMDEWHAAARAWSDEFGENLLKAVRLLSPDGRHRVAQAGLQRPPP